MSIERKGTEKLIIVCLITNPFNCLHQTKTGKVPIPNFSFINFRKKKSKVANL